MSERDSKITLDMTTDPGQAMNENEALVAAIKAEQAARGMTQEELAKRAGVSVTSMQRYLAGDRLIRSDLMWKMGQALEVPTSALWADAERRLRQAQEKVRSDGANASDPTRPLDATGSGDTASQMAEQLSALRSLVASLGGDLQDKAKASKKAQVKPQGDTEGLPTPGQPHAI